MAAYCKNIIGVYASLTLANLFIVAWPLFLIDIPRFYFTAYISLFLELFDRKGRRKRELFKKKLLAEPPLVTVVVPAYNESEHLFATITSLKNQTYPNLEIIIINDGSTDNTGAIANAQSGGNVRVVHGRFRQGKAFGHNMGLLLAQGEYLVVCDGDTLFHPNAILEVILPFADTRVKGVAGNLKVKNLKESWITRFQALEYLFSIEMGRRFSARFGILWIISGAFGAFHVDTVRKIGGWEVSPGEDQDLTIGLRKMGHRVDFAPYAISYTDVPPNIKGLFRQRYSWSRSPVALFMRKHRDLLLTGLSWNNFSFKNFISAWDSVGYNFIFNNATLIMLFYIAILAPDLMIPMMVLVAILYTLLDITHFVAALILSRNRRELLPLIPLLPFFWAYIGIYQKVVSVFALIDELFYRASYRDRYVPDAISRVKPIWGTEDPFINSSMESVLAVREEGLKTSENR